MTSGSVDVESPGVSGDSGVSGLSHLSGASGAEAEQRPRWVLPVVACLTVLALVVRTMMALRSGMWRDEAWVMFAIDEPSWRAMLGFLAQHDSHPPLFYAVMRVWVSLAGGSDAAALAIPIALGVALVPTIYAVGVRLFSWRAGLVAAVLATLSPVAVEYSAVVRPYSLLPLLALVGTHALVRAVDAGGRRWWAAYAAATLALVYTHNWAWLVVGAQWVAVAILLWRGVPRRRSDVVRGFAAAQLVVALGFLPWLPSFANQARYAGHAAIDFSGFFDTPLDVLSLPIVLGRTFLSGTLVPPGANLLAGAVIGWALVVVASCLVLARGRRTPRGSALTVLATVPAAALIAATVVSARGDMLQGRCILTVAPMLLLLVGHGVDRLLASGHGRIAALAAVALAGTYAALLPQQVTTPRSQARELARDLDARTAPTDLVLIAPAFISSSINRYSTAPIEHIDFPVMGRVGAVYYDRTAQRFADPAALAEAERRLAAAHAAGRRIWLVVDHGSTICTGAQCDEIATRTGRSVSFVTVGYARSSELREYLGTLYGPPVSCDDSTYARGSLEALDLCLFAPR